MSYKWNLNPKNLNNCLNKTTIRLRSSWEFEFVEKLINATNIQGWASEGTKFRYFNIMKNREANYIMDFTILMKDKKDRNVIHFVEIKPYNQTIPPKKRSNTNVQKFEGKLKLYQVNTSKWEAVRRFCKAENEKIGYERYKFSIKHEKNTPYFGKLSKAINIKRKRKLSKF